MDEQKSSHAHEVQWGITTIPIGADKPRVIAENKRNKLQQIKKNTFQQPSQYIEYTKVRPTPSAIQNTVYYCPVRPLPPKHPFTVLDKKNTTEYRCRAIKADGFHLAAL